MAKKSKKPDGPKNIFKPFLLSLAGATGWGALHSPANFGSVGQVGAWLIYSLAVGLLVRAFLALLGPIFKLCGEIFRHTVLSENSNDQNDAGQ